MVLIIYCSTCFLVPCLIITQCSTSIEARRSWQEVAFQLGRIDAHTMYPYLSLILSLRAWCCQTIGDFS